MSGAYSDGWDAGYTGEALATMRSLDYPNPHEWVNGWHEGNRARAEDDGKWEAEDDFGLEDY